MATRSQRYISYGQSQPLINVFPSPIVANRPPTAADQAEIGQLWVDEPGNDAYILTSIVANVSTWVNVGGGAGIFASLTVNPGPTVLNGTTTVNGTNNVARSIYLNTNGGILETIELFNQQGTDAASINIHSAVGGTTVGGNTLTLTSNTGTTLQSLANDVNIAAQTGSINITPGEDAAQAVYIHANSGTNETIEIRSEQGTSADALDLVANAGGISLTADLNITLTSGEASATAIELVALDNAGGIVLSAGNLITLETTTNNGNIQIVADENAVAGGVTAITIDAFTGVGTFAGVTTASGATETFTLTCNKITATSGVLVSIATVGAEDAQMTITRVSPGAGTCEIKAKNNGAAALNSDLILSFVVLS